MMNLLPPVEKVTFNQGFLELKDPIKYCFLDDLVNVFIQFTKNVEKAESQEDADIIFCLNKELSSQSYAIRVDEKIIIEYSSDASCFYAVQTLKNYINNNKIRKMEIFDKPKLELRGFMLDISRNKVAKVSEIKKLIDLMAELKMNHLELYVEGFSFGYKSFSKYLEDEGYISLDEYLELEKYANDRFIDFVPNQNGFGHMTDWLKQDEFKDLAVCPNGIDLWGRHRIPSTLNPLDPKSLELVKKMYDDMLPYTKSKYFNMNFDEPFELGHGYTEGMNREDVYVDFVNKVYEKVKKHNKTPLMWGDVLVRHDDKWDKLPDDIIFIDWGYDANYPFSKHAKRLSEKNVSFVLASGTCSWSSFAGRYIDWYENIKNSVDAAYEYHGLGVIVTDWGDFGHLQFFNASLAPIIFMGLYSWSHKEGLILNINDALTEYLHDESGILSEIMLDLNNYYRFDTGYAGNGTKTFYRFMWASVAKDDCEKVNMTPFAYYVSKVGMNALSKNKFKVLENFYTSKLKDINLVKSKNKEIKLILSELKQTILILRMIDHFSMSINEDLTDEERLKYLGFVISNKDKYLQKQRELWLKRNKKGGLETSLKCLTDFFDTVENIRSSIMTKQIIFNEKRKQ